jgi:hypothetical protein
MPARKKPVKKRSESKLFKLLPSHIIPKLNNEPSKALIKNTFEGENRSTIFKIEKVNVPIINPNCTAEVKCPKALILRSKCMARLSITPLPANQSDVQQNCEIIITGSINLLLTLTPIIPTNFSLALEK